MQIWNIISGLICLIVAIPISITVIIYYKEYMQKRLPFQRHLIHTLIAVDFYTLMESYAYFHFLIPNWIWPDWVFLLPGFFLIPAMFSLMMFLDSISADRINPYRLAISCILATFVLIFAFFSDSMGYYESIFGDISFTYLGNFSLGIGVLGFYIGHIWFYYSLQIYRKSDQKNKKIALYNLNGGIMAGLLGPILYILGFQKFIPGVDNMCVGFGLVCTSYAYLKRPQLAYTLPFIAYRLMVINESGLPIYKYIWHSFSPSEENDEDLFPAMLSGVGLMFKTSINQGMVKEVHLEHAKLLFTYSNKFKLTYVFVSNESSTSLRQGLTRFMEAFENKFFTRLENVIEFSQFHLANALIQEIFAYIP